MSGGKRAGSRRAARPPRRFRPDVLLLALGITLAVIAWGYLVYAAIDFGSDARGGDSHAWAFLGLAAVGAVACLFVGLMLIARLARALGITAVPAPRSEQPAPPEPSATAPSTAPSTAPAASATPASPASRRHRAD